MGWRIAWTGCQSHRLAAAAHSRRFRWSRIEFVSIRTCSWVGGCGAEAAGGRVERDPDSPAGIAGPVAQVDVLDVRPEPFVVCVPAADLLDAIASHEHAAARHPGCFDEAVDWLISAPPTRGSNAGPTMPVLWSMAARSRSNVVGSTIRSWESMTANGASVSSQSRTARLAAPV